MFGSNIKKHWNEFSNYVRNNQYEAGEGQIFFPRANATASGIYTHWVTGQESGIQNDRNLIVDEGLIHILNVVMLGTPVAELEWYVMIHSASATPDKDTTSGTYESAHNEIVSAVEGYTEATRILWVGDAVDEDNTEISNTASPAQFTIATTGTLPVWGAALTSLSTKGGSTGTLMSIGKFSAQRNLSDTDEFNLKYKVDFDGV
jgi:hypothetical protein